MTEKTNNKQKNKKIVLALVWNLPVRRLFGGRLGICDSCLPLAWYLKFACPPSFWWGACNLVLVCDLPARRLFGGVLGICDFRHKTPRQSQISLTWPRGPGFSGHNKYSQIRSQWSRFRPVSIFWLKCQFLNTSRNPKFGIIFIPTWYLMRYPSSNSLARCSHTK